MLASRATTLALCWRVTRRDDALVLGTEHDQDLMIASGPLAGTYAARAGITGSSIRSSSDLSVDNLSVDGAISQDLSLLDLTAADIEAGLFDDAAVVLFMVDWQAPSDGQVVLRTGNLGNIERTSEGMYRAELRGLTQRLRQVVVRTYSASCDAELGDSRCGVSLAALTASGTVTAVTSRRRFNATLTGGGTPTAGDFVGGLLTFTSGANDGFSMEVKRDAVDDVLGRLELFELMPAEVEIGDTFTVTPGCDKTLATCRDRFSNILNFRGHGALIPGRTKIIQYGET
jgi:uncharacterized phage protein (TIGR02218 family)